MNCPAGQVAGHACTHRRQGQWLGRGPVTNRRRSERRPVVATGLHRRAGGFSPTAPQAVSARTPLRVWPVVCRKSQTPPRPKAAGIDIGSASHFVAVPADRDDEPVREFASFTADLHRLADWPQACGVDTVAMASTGVYWIPLFELLDARGFTVLLVNARHVKNVSGRKRG